MNSFIRNVSLVVMICCASTTWAQDSSSTSSGLESQSEESMALEAIPADDAEITQDDEVDEAVDFSGRIEDGRNFVWAAYGLTWAVLMIYGVVVVVRSRTAGHFEIEQRGQKSLSERSAEVDA